MKTYLVKDLMVPLSEYATVSENATLYEAVLELEKAQEDFDHTRYRHRGILIYDNNKKIVGKLGQLDILRALEPQYSEMGGRQGLQRFGFSKRFMKSMLEQYRLLDGALTDICRKAGEKKVANFMVTPAEGEYVEENASFDEAIHQMVLGHFQSLLVTNKDGDIVGILRLTDVFAAVFHRMKECGLDA